MADNNYSVTYTLSPELVERIRSLGHDTKAFPSNLTLSGSNPNKDYIVNKIAGDWLNLFDRIGLDQKRVEAVRDIKMFDGINPTSVASARAKANRAGYSEIIFKSPRSTKGIKSAAVVLLQGRNPTTKALVNLAIGTSTDGKDLPAKINAIEKYLASP